MQKPRYKRRGFVFYTECTAFVFVIQGAFETNGVLLHARDGLALWNHFQIEMEALSNDAIITVIVLDEK